MPCPDIQTLTWFADDELAVALRAEMEQHIAACTSCREALAELQALNAAGRRALAAIPVSSPPALARRAAPFRSRALLAAAAVLLVGCSIAILILTRGRPATQAQLPETPPVQQPAIAATTQTRPAVDPLSDDEAFERWAAEHRRKRIPLIPLEEVGRYRRAEFQPYRGA